MSLKELKESMEKDNLFFGIRHVLKNSKNLNDVFLAKDARPETVKRLESLNIEFTVLKSKADLRKELNIDFDCEVFSTSKTSKSPKKSKK